MTFKKRDRQIVIRMVDLGKKIALSDRLANGGDALHFEMTIAYKFVQRLQIGDDTPFILPFLRYQKVARNKPACGISSLDYRTPDAWVSTSAAHKAS